jgi:hypothetical protein
MLHLTALSNYKCRKTLRLTQGTATLTYEQMYHTLLWNFCHKNVPLSFTPHNVQVVPLQAMKACRVRVHIHAIKQMVSVTLWPLHPWEKVSWYPTEQEAESAFRRREKSLALPRIEPTKLSHLPTLLKQKKGCGLHIPDPQCIDQSWFCRKF